MLICGHPAATCVDADGHDDDAGDLARGVLLVRVEAHPPTAPLSTGRPTAGAPAVRVGRPAPCSLLVVDRRVAVVSHPGDDAASDRVDIVTDPLVVRAYRSWAHDHIRRSWPLSLVAPDGCLPDPSPVERRVLGLLGSGTGDVEIARQLGITDRQVRRYIRSLEARLGVRSRFQLGVRSAELGWSQLISPTVSGTGHRPATTVAPAARPLP